MQERPASSSKQYIGSLDGTTDLGFWINVNQNRPITWLEELDGLDKIDPHLLHTLDYATADPAPLELICMDVTQSPQVGSRVLTAKLFRLKEPQCVVVRFQRRFGLRSEMRDVAEYIPISSFREVIAEYYEAVGASPFKMAVTWRPGEHGAVVVWCIGLLLPETSRIADVLASAQEQICDLEEIYASRMIHVDATRPWQSTEHIDQGRWFSRFETEQLRKTAHIELIRQLGSGGVSTTWVARDLLSETELVLKMLAPDLRFGEPDILRGRFHNEYEIGTRLEASECCPRFLSRGSVLGRDYFTMDYHRLPTLRDWMLEGKRTVSDKQSMLLSLIRAVGRMHAAGVIHRDLSPKNILVGPNGQTFLIDFGAATYRSKSEQDILELTLPGHEFGSLKYSAPELRDSAKNGSLSSDVFSLGVIIYEAMLGKNIAGNVPSLTELGFDVGHELSRFASRAISFSPSERPQATVDFAES